MGRNVGPLQTLLAFALVLGACAAESTPVHTIEYSDGASATVYEPEGIEAAPVIVLFHDCCGDSADLAQLALELARNGAAVVNANWTTPTNGGGWPVSYADVSCALSFARDNAARFGGDPSRIVAAAWGDSAMLLSVVALNPLGIPGGCETTVPAVVAIDGYFGISGDEAAPVIPTSDALKLLGTISVGNIASDAPGNPYTYVRYPSETRFLLIAGTADLRLTNARRWERELTAASQNVALIGLKGDHFNLVNPHFPAGVTVVEQLIEMAAQQGSAP